MFPKSDKQKGNRKQDEISGGSERELTVSRIISHCHLINHETHTTEAISIRIVDCVKQIFQTNSFSSSSVVDGSDDYNDEENEEEDEGEKNNNNILINNKNYNSKISQRGTFKWRVWKGEGTLLLFLLLVLLLEVKECFSFTSSSTGSYAGSSSSDNESGSSHPVVPGAVMHLFPRYGYLSLSMRVVPRNDTQNWIFLEPSKEVFSPSTIRLQQQSFASTDNSLPLHNEFHIDLCEDVQQLVQAYFRRFNIETLDKPWHAFAGGWRTPSLAKYFGIDPAFVTGDYRYMLVRVLMVRSAGRADPMPNVTVLPNFANNVNSFRVKDYVSSFNFFNDVGTHYISSYLTGNSIYQVFVYDNQGFEAVKRRLSETGWVRSSYMAQLPYLLPLWVKHMGKVMVLNANQQTTQSIREALTIRFLFSVYPNIFKMHDNADLVRKIEKYLKHEPDGLLGLELKTLDVIFKDPGRRKWFDETLQQTLQLWEVNLR